MLTKLAGWLAVAFAVWYLLTNPDAAGVVLGIRPRTLRQRPPPRRVPGRPQAVMRERVYYERGQPGEVLTW